jgi:hypothetical protein
MVSFSLTKGATVDNKQKEHLRTELAKAILHRITSFDLAGKAAEKVAKNMILGASNYALINEEKEEGQFLHSMFTDVVEFGIRLIYKWAGEPMPVKESLEEKEAA